MRDPWRKRCPEGHASLTIHNDRQSFRCEACGKTYDHPPVDAAKAGAWK